MRGVLLAAGLGTRLSPLTDVTPKCLMPIKGTPLLGIWLERLTLAGVTPLLINTHYLAEQVVEYVAASHYSNKLTLIHEPNLLGTAGTLLANFDFYMDEDVMVVHADNYCLADLSAFILAHSQRPSSCILTMMTFRTNTPSACGIVEVDNRGVVISFHEKVVSPPGNLANGAIYIVSAELIREIKLMSIPPKDFSTEVLSNLVGRIYTHETSDVFIDIGTPESYAMANVS